MGRAFESSIHPLSLFLRCQVAHIVLNLDAKLHYQCVLLRAKMAACGLERAHSCRGVVLLASKGLLREPHSMLLCFDSGSFTARSTVSYMDTQSEAQTGNR